jgi:hypothetical protein
MEKKKYTLSREMYRGIKQMDSEQMADFLGNVFQEGFNAALGNTNNITLEDLHNVIGTVKGIGDKRMEEIDNAIKQLFIERNGNNG